MDAGLASAGAMSPMSPHVLLAINEVHLSNLMKLAIGEVAERLEKRRHHDSCAQLEWITLVGRLDGESLQLKCGQRRGMK